MEEQIVEYKPAKGSKKNYNLIFLFFMIILSMMGILLFLIHKKNLEYNTLKEKTNNLLVEMSNIPEQSMTSKPEVDNKYLGNKQSVSELTVLPLIYREKLLLLPQLIKLKQALRSGNNISNSLIKEENIKDLYLIKSIEEINSFSQNFYFSYYQLKKNFNIIKKLLERDITASKFVSLGFSTKIAEYISKVFNYRVLTENQSMPETIENDLVRIEQYLEQEDIESALKELKKFENVKGLMEYEYELQQYLRINLLIDSLISYIVNLKEIE